jgi:hypothetical protein
MAQAREIGSRARDLTEEENDTLVDEALVETRRRRR